MKKAKIMLLTIGVIAIVGGALAFKARTFDLVDLCTAPTQGILDPCPAQQCVDITLQRTGDADVTNLCYTVIPHKDTNTVGDCPEDGCINPGEAGDVN